MANIQLSELNPAGSELFIDSESFLQDLNDTDAMLLQGGEGKSGCYTQNSPPPPCYSIPKKPCKSDDCGFDPWRYQLFNFSDD